MPDEHVQNQYTRTGLQTSNVEEYMYPGYAEQKLST